MSYILVIWGVIAMAGTQSSVHYERGWHPIGEFNSQAACIEAARQLNVESKHVRCLPKGQP